MDCTHCDEKLARIAQLEDTLTSLARQALDNVDPEERIHALTEALAPV